MTNPSLPIPSVKAGYYQDEFDLYFETKYDGTIYYTLDGSTPTENSKKYDDNGIKIRNRSDEENEYNSIQNVVTDWKDYWVSTEKVPKGTVVRALYVNEWGNKSEVLTQTYWVGIEEPERGYTLSLVFEKEKFFGDEGIHVTGKDYDDWYLSENPEGESPFPNYLIKHYETDCIAELFENDNELINQQIGIRIQGASTRESRKKRFVLVSREEYSGSELFDAEIYENTVTHSVMLKGYLTDAMTADIISDRSVAVQRSKPVRVFLNGEYWYDSYMLERYDSQYFYDHYGVDTALMVRDGWPDEDSERKWKGETYFEFLDWVSSNDFSKEEVWQELETKIDVQSYIDYITTNYYLCNGDFTEHKNYVMWRSDTADMTSDYEDARWRWCIYDIDMIAYAAESMFYEHAAEINIFSSDLPFVDRKLNETLLFSSFKNSERFRERFVTSFMDMLNNNFSEANMEMVLEKYGYDLDWGNEFFRLRPSYAVKHLADEFELKGTINPIKITVDDPEGGKVQINTSIIDLSSGSWDGEYFSDYPITITAYPNEGYVFKGWTKGVDSMDSTISITLGSELELQPIFEEK